jgi:hypothetical protein
MVTRTGNYAKMATLIITTMNDMYTTFHSIIWYNETGVDQRS